MQVGWLAEVDAAFSGTGIKSFVLEGALGELQVCRVAPRRASHSWGPRLCRGQHAAAPSRHGMAAGCAARGMCVSVAVMLSAGFTDPPVCCADTRPQADVKLGTETCQSL